MRDAVDYIELLDVEQFKHLVDCVMRLDTKVATVVSEADAALRDCSSATDIGVEAAYERVRHAEQDLAVASEDDYAVAESNCELARKHCATVEGAAERLRTLIDRCMVRGARLDDIRPDLLVGARHYLSVRFDAVDEYLQCQPDGRRPEFSIIGNPLPALLIPVQAAIEATTELTEQGIQATVDIAGTTIESGIELIDALFQTLFGPDGPVSGIFVDPEKVRQFAACLAGMLESCTMSLNAMNAQLGSLHETWRDQDYEYFRDALGGCRAHLQQFEQSATIMYARLIDAADHAETYRRI